MINLLAYWFWQIYHLIVSQAHLTDDTRKDMTFQAWKMKS